MAEYIDREALLNEINLQKRSSKTSYPKRSFVVGDVLTCIYTAPTADAVEVVHGRWIDAREYCGDYMCSNCDALYSTNKFKYCPNCGAKMDGGKHETD